MKRIHRQVLREERERKRKSQRILKTNDSTDTKEENDYAEKQSKLKDDLSAKNVPGVGHYFPRYSYIEAYSPKTHITSITNEQKVKERVNLRDTQKTNVCLRVIKSLNFSVGHQRSQAEHLAERNRKFLIKEIKAN